MPYGTLDDAPERAPMAHMITGSKAAWYESRDDLPQYDTYPWEGAAGSSGRRAPGCG